MYHKFNIKGKFGQSNFEKNVYLYMRILGINAFTAGCMGNIQNSTATSTSTPLFNNSTSARVDSYTSVNNNSKVLPKEGSTEPEVLAQAPSCNITVQGQKKKATIVVDLASCRLYKYDEQGNPEIAYSIAKGKPSTPTHTGIRQVSHVEVSPYKTAPRTTKRRWNPAPYGKRVIVLDKVDPSTGKTDSTGEFIHGNGDKDTSMGKAVSGGCMRLPNVAVIELAKHVKRGDYVLIQ